MNILVIDGQGGQIVKAIRAEFENHKVMAVGTNATATASMLKAGAHEAVVIALQKVIRK